MRLIAYKIGLLFSILCVLLFGVIGCKGDTGPRGPQGEQGQKGDKGDSGGSSSTPPTFTASATFSLAEALVQVSGRAVCVYTWNLTITPTSANPIRCTGWSGITSNNNDETTCSLYITDPTNFVMTTGPLVSHVTCIGPEDSGGMSLLNPFLTCTDEVTGLSSTVAVTGTTTSTACP